MSWNLRLTSALMSLALASVVTGCTGSSGSSPAPGVTATTITIGSHQPLSGPNSAGWSERAPASNAYFDYVNAHGGIYGRKIIYDYRDDAYTPANTATVVHQLVDKDKVFAIFNPFGTTDHQAVVNYLNAQKVPDLFPASGCTCWNKPEKLPYTFGWEPDFIREGKTIGFYVNKEYSGKRIAYFYQNDGYGREIVAGLDREIPASSVVSRQSYLPNGNIGVTAQVKDMTRAKADVIIISATTSYVALIRLAQRELGSRAQLVVTSGQSDPNTLESLLESSGGGPGSGSALIQGIITDSWLIPITDTGNSWIALLKKVHDKYLPSAPFDQNFEFGVAFAYTFVQALVDTGPKLTRDALISTIEAKGSNFTPAFGVVPFRYSRSSHAGCTGVQMARIQGNSIVLTGQPLITDDEKGPITPYVTVLPPAPASGVPAP